MNFFQNILRSNKVLLAPMAGITFKSYRQFFVPFGVGLFYTEMVSDKGLIYGNDETFRYLPHKDEITPRPLGIQLFGSSAETLVQAIRIIEARTDNYDFIDINLGCSVPKVTKSGSGAALLKDLVKLKEIMQAVVAASKRPVSAKIRLGWQHNQVHEIIQVLVESGVQLIAIHPRYAAQLFRDKPHWDLVKDIQSGCPVPIVISGDIFTLDDAINALSITQARGVMVARGAIGNPLLVSQINAHFNNESIPASDLCLQKDYALTLTDLVIQEFGESKGVKILRGLLPKFFNDFPNAKTCRNELSRVSSKEAINRIIEG